MSRPVLCLLLLALLVGCTTRRSVTVSNRSSKAVEVRLEERHPQYAVYLGDLHELAPGSSLEFWYDAEFESAIVVLDQAGKELQRTELKPSDQPPVIHGGQPRER